MIRAIVTVFAAFAAACSPQPAAQAVAPVETASIHPESGLRVVPITVTTAKGKRTLRVEVAASAEEQARGLMFRTALGPDEGMIFPRNPPEVASFWMKNTPLPLDIIFVGPDRKVINVAARTVPYSLEPVGALGPTALVLELNGGRAAELGIGPGTPVAW